MLRFKIVTLLVLLSYFAFTQNLNWAKQIIGGSFINCSSMQLDAAGNIYVTGTYSVSDFDPGPATASLSSNGNRDIFMAKYDNLGNYIWAKGIGGPGTEGAIIKLDASGNIYLVGSFYTTVDFDPGVGVTNLTSNGSSDAFMAKYDNSGNYIWAKSFGSTGSDFCQDMELDNLGNIYVTGSFEVTTDFDPGSNTHNLTSFGDEDVFMAKYDALGNYVWAKNMGGINTDGGGSIQLDATGNVFISSYFTDTVDCDPGIGTYTLTFGGGENIFFAKYDNGGNFIWAKAVGGNNCNLGGYMHLDPSGNIYLAGYFSSTADFDPGTNVANLVSAGSEDIFIAKYDPAGNYTWAKKNGGINGDMVFSICQNLNKNIYLTGRKNSNMLADIFILKYDTAGNELSEMDMGSGMYNSGNSIQVDASENVYLAGDFSGTLNIDPNTVSSTSLVAVGYTDMFIAKYNSGVTNVKTFSEADQIVTYPNPAINFFTVDLSKNEKFDIIVRDCVGNVVAEIKNVSGNCNIECKQFASGLYFIQAIGKNNFLTGKIIKE